MRILYKTQLEYYTKHNENIIQNTIRILYKTQLKYYTNYNENIIQNLPPN